MQTQNVLISDLKRYHSTLTTAEKMWPNYPPACVSQVLPPGLMIRSCVYPEPVDEVIAGQQVVHEELEGVVSGGLVKRENIKRPLVHFLENNRQHWIKW